MARRPCSCSSREKFSGTSPSEHTSPALFTYQNWPSTPAEFTGHTVRLLWTIRGLKLNFRFNKCAERDLIQRTGKEHIKPTFNVVGPITKLQSEDVIDGPVGVQRVGVPVVADESMLASQNQHGSVDQFQSEQFVVTWREKSKQRLNVYVKKRAEEENYIHVWVIPGESLTASSWPFFLVQTYFPLLALSATLWLIHSTENMALADLNLEGKEGEIKKFSNPMYNNEYEQQQ